MKRTNIPGTSPFEPIIGFSRAVRIGNQIHVSGTGPVGADEADVAEKTNQRRTHMFPPRAEDGGAAGRIHGKFFGIVRPAATMVVVAALLNPAWRIEIEADALIPEE